MLWIRLQVDSKPFLLTPGSLGVTLSYKRSLNSIIPTSSPNSKLQIQFNNKSPLPHQGPTTNYPFSVKGVHALSHQVLHTTLPCDYLLDNQGFWLHLQGAEGLKVAGGSREEAKRWQRSGVCLRWLHALWAWHTLRADFLLPMLFGHSSETPNITLT